MTDTLFDINPNDQTDPVTTTGTTCLDCGTPIPHQRHRYSGQAPHRCATCRPIHQRAVARARLNGTTVEVEKTRQFGTCQLCGAALTDHRSKYCAGDCRRRYRRAYERAWKYGTDIDDELQRETSDEGQCRVCGDRPSHINRDFCQPCIDVGARKVYQRAATQYGATHQQAQQLASATECAICHRPVDRSRKYDSDQHSGAHIDHDHATGQIRGILCGHCNRAIGHLHDDPLRALAVADYLIGLRATVTVDDTIRSVAYADTTTAAAWRTVIAQS